MTDYHAKGFFKNGHFNTIYAHFFSDKQPLPYTREQLKHPDGFSLYLDWIQQDSDKLVILSHGLESHSNARYITSMGRHLISQDYDILSWHCRNCAPNEATDPQAFYHSGISEDLDFVIKYALNPSKAGQAPYRQVILVGFSMGGNITLKYLGEQGQNLPKEIRRAVAVSTPLDLVGCSHSLMRFPNQVYGRNFLRTLTQKVRQQRPHIKNENINYDKVLKSTNLRDFDHHFTAHVHGFDSQDDYYTKASSLPWLNKITVPTLLINAKDDPFLSDTCYPSAQQINNGHIKTLYPAHGGHLGFYTNPNLRKESQGLNWLDKVAVDQWLHWVHSFCNARTKYHSPD